ncbi:transcriptional regulator, MarR family [Candidatus Vecturithrix granuli]|uniref:Transcriptional regulator, MarR family n=1 Tax=Vecturithrix granuli TaxID=1499967 RepID=A0A081C673_VECG1|nr:transcriptional regulator, MarR family [Candidatus Vecturithrix granuli]
MKDHVKKPQESLGRLIACLYHQARSYFEKELAPYDLGSGAMPVLKALLYHDGINQQELSEKLHVDKATTTRAIAKLIENGYVRREKDIEDHRAYRLFVTQKAQDIAPEIQRVLQSWTAILAEGLTEKEKEAALALLQHMRNNALRHKVGEEGE